MDVKKQKQREVALSAIIILVFFRYGSSATTTTTSLSSRTEWLSLLQLRSSLKISKKDWPRKSEPCRNWTGVACQNGSVVGIKVSGLRRTRMGRLDPSFEVDSLANLTLLASFNASGFMLNGSIPEWFGDNNLGSLKMLDLSSCSITGLIPDSLGGLRVLKSLLLSRNSLTGRMPSTLGRLSELSVLDLSGNSLSGSVPDSLSSLQNLKTLDLSSNFLSGSVPPELGTLQRLQRLNLSSNVLTDSVPIQLGNLSQLVELDLSINSLSGSLPYRLFAELLSLEVVVLSSNALSDALPASLCSLPSLHVLDVSNNNLTGPLPKFSKSFNVSSSSGAIILNLSNNLFYGSLNSTSLEKFKIIDLSGNYFQGEVHVGALGNVTLDKNCLQMVANQRDFEECRQFYLQRNLPFESKSRINNTTNNKRVIFIMAGTFGGFGFIVILVLVLILLLKHYGNNHRSLEIQRGTPNGGPFVEGESPTPPKEDPLFVNGVVGESFTFEKMLYLTGNFDEANIIKYGHSGVLFRGVLESGATVVVKRVDLNACKRESHIVELGLLSKASHARLVPILGHCLEHENDKCIVYKYMPNGDLASSLHKVTAPDGNLKSLDWITRLKIAIGAAEGLVYLHECNPPLVHRDVQASSILLDDKFEVRLGSLSEVTAQGDLHQRVMSKLFNKPSSSNQGDSVTSPVTCADDVYCFGKILLELVTGNIDVSGSDDATTKKWLEHTLPYISIYDKERVTKIVDPSLIVDEDLMEEVWAMAIVARSCMNAKASKRPHMRHVLKALENPLKVVREENFSSVKLRTTSSTKSWSYAFFGSWRQSSSDSATATGHMNRDSTSGSKQSGKVGSQGSAGIDHSSSNKRSSSEVFPEPLEMLDFESGGDATKY